MRNWRYGESVDGDEVAKNLNDGPESLVFLPTDESRTAAAPPFAVAPRAAARAHRACFSLARQARGLDGSFTMPGDLLSGAQSLEGKALFTSFHGGPLFVTPGATFDANDYVAGGVRHGLHGASSPYDPAPPL